MTSPVWNRNSGAIQSPCVAGGRSAAAAANAKKAAFAATREIQRFMTLLRFVRLRAQVRGQRLERFRGGIHRDRGRRFAAPGAFLVRARHMPGAQAARGGRREIEAV